MDDPLAQSPQFLKGVGPKRVALLAKLGIRTVRDVLYYPPRGYQDRTHVQHIKDIQVGEVVSIVGEVLKCDNRRTRGGQHITEMFIGDDTGVVSATWFNPRDGKETKLTIALAAANGKCSLPERLNEEDWVLILKRVSD